MDYFVEQAASDEEVQSLIRRKYGDRARILSRKELRSGGILGMFQKRVVEVTGYCSHAPAARSGTGRGSMSEERRKILDAVRGATQAPARMEDGSTAAGTTASPSFATAPAQAHATSVGATGNPPAAPGAAPSSAPAASLDTVLTELRSLRETVGRSTPESAEPEGITRLREILEDNDFGPGYIRGMVDRLRRECSFAELSDVDRVLQRSVTWIEESIDVYPWQERRKRPHVFVLVGPTGVGKTTTIAKLAAMYGAVADPSYDVRILTIDSYRIGALQQIEKYGEIMNIPVNAIESAQEMRKQLDLHHDADFIFVDTIGKSPNDLTKLAEVNQLVRAAGGEVHLAVSATTKRSDICDILRQFEPFNYQAVVVTKMDETSSVGGILSALGERQKSVSFVTDGQSVPQDIERARKEIFLGRLRDLPAAREYAQAREKE